MLPWLWIRACVGNSPAVVWSIPWVFFRASSAVWAPPGPIPAAAANGFCRQQQRCEFEVIPANFPAAHRISWSSRELTGGLIPALGCCLAKPLAAADTLELPLCRLKTTLHCFAFAHIWMIIFAIMKSTNLFFQLKSSGFKYVLASGFSFTSFVFVS